MSASRDRKEAAKRMGLSLRTKYRALVEADGEEAITAAAIDLGGHFNNNVEFIIWCLLEYGGVQQLPYERPKAALKQDGLPSMPGVLRAGVDMASPAQAGVCNCGAEWNKHLASCPACHHLILSND